MAYGEVVKPSRWIKSLLQRATQCKELANGSLNTVSSMNKKFTGVLVLASKRIVLAADILIVIAALFYFLNLKGGHDWGGDFSMYIMNARNLVNGIPYAQTNYVYNIDTALYGPKAYPPVFPLMLAPIIAIWGVNLEALKIVGILCFIAFLFYTNHKIVPRDTHSILRIAYFLIIGFYPSFFSQLDCILSDIPFLLFCTIAIKRINDQVQPEVGSKQGWFQACLTGLVIYLAYGTRSVGLILLPTLLFLDLIKHRKVSISTLIVLVTASSLIILQSVLIPDVGGYIDQLPKSLGGAVSLVASSAFYYFKIFVAILPFKNYIFQNIVFLFVLEFALLGLLSQSKKGISAFELFFIFYIAFILFWPSYQGLRFIYPIISLYFLYFIQGFQYLFDNLKRLPSWLSKAFPIALLLCVCLYYFSAYTALIPRPISDLEKSEAQELFRFVQTNTGDNDLIAFFKPRVMALFTNRKSLAIAVPAPNGDTLGRMNELGVKYLIVRENYDFVDQPMWVNLVGENPHKFKIIYKNADFRMYEFIYGGRTEPENSPGN